MVFTRPGTNIQLINSSQSRKQRTQKQRKASKRHYDQNHSEILEARRQKRKTTAARVRKSSPAAHVDHVSSSPDILPPDILPANAPSIPAQAEDALAAGALISLAQLSISPSEVPARRCFSDASQASHPASLEYQESSFSFPGITPWTDEQRARFESTGMLRLTHVQQQQMQVARLNARPKWSPQPAEDEPRWGSNVFPGVPYLSPAHLNAIIEWRAAVDAIPAEHRVPGIRRFRPVFNDTKQWERRDPRLMTIPVRHPLEKILPLQSWDDLIAIMSQRYGPE
ncbi:hypothetical protein C8F01DRAFT_1264860 [Mycena amicta]|nr:hypothetical protein C8F01DRAFT_1264792 [Mycena amicta]KAJ7049815.1 hypothetical protein C8F01DRAFT_1264860 [Mycena amicta]